MSQPNYSTTCAVCYDPISPTEPAMLATDTATGVRVRVHPACGLAVAEKEIAPAPKRMCGAERTR